MVETSEWPSSSCTVLMVALLTAVGIDSTPALISTDDIYQPPSVPVLYFDHVITYIPSLNLFLDATAKQTPFAVLDQQNQGKPTLLLASAEIKYTPFDKAHQARRETLTLMSVTKNGEIIGSSIYRPAGGRKVSDPRFPLEEPGRTGVEEPGSDHDKQPWSEPNCHFSAFASSAHRTLTHSASSTCHSNQAS